MILEIQFPTFLFLRLFKTTRNGKWSLKKMDNPRFVDEEEIPLVQDEDYDDYNTPNASRVDDTSFIEPAATEATSTLRLNQKVKQDKLAALYRHFVTGNLDLINLHRFKLTTGPKKGATNFEFYNSDRWVPVTKQTVEFFALKTLRHRFSGVNTMKKFLGINRTPPALERLLSPASKLKSELPTDLEMESITPIELSSLVEDIFLLKHEKHHKIPTLICENFLVLTRSYKAYSVNS